MYSKKYRIVGIEENVPNPTHEDMKGKICYLAYLNVSERGWFLLETDEWFNPVHRIHTSEIKDVEYTNDCVIVTTENTKYTFELV